MSSHPCLYNIDFCFDAASPGSLGPEGHYTLNFDFISRGAPNSPWSKVSGDLERMIKGKSFGFDFYDLSKAITQIDNAVISLRPDADTPADRGIAVLGRGHVEAARWNDASELGHDGQPRVR